MSKIKAFTLAEVLITLVIIGVVAALTIPTVITNYQKNMYVTQLKKEYNQITNAFKTAMAREGVSKLTDTTLWSMIPDGATIEPYHLEGADAAQNELQKIFNVNRIFYSVEEMANMYKSRYKYLNGDFIGIEDLPAGGLILTDGAIMSFYLQKEIFPSECQSKSCSSLEEFQKYHNTTTKCWHRLGFIFIDVNGAKGPNILGRDFFAFVLTNDGALFPIGGNDFAVKEGCSHSDINSRSCEWHWNYNGVSSHACNLSSMGNGCQGRIMEEGWKMEY